MEPLPHLARSAAKLVYLVNLGSGEVDHETRNTLCYNAKTRDSACEHIGGRTRETLERRIEHRREWPQLQNPDRMLT